MRCCLYVALLSLILATPAAPAGRRPNLEFRDRAGKSVRTADLRGSIAVINFWATWCGPCQEELPLLNRLNTEYAAKKVRFIAVSADQAKNRAAVDRFLEAHPVGMDIWLGADLDMLDRAGLGNELPATLILDEQGEVVERVLGQAREEDIRRPIEWLLGARNGPAPQGVVKHY
jgi:thiol-disulfide isomerase/thioredoxin